MSSRTITFNCLSERVNMCDFEFCAYNYISHDLAYVLVGQPLFIGLGKAYFCISSTRNSSRNQIQFLICSLSRKRIGSYIKHKTWHLILYHIALYLISIAVNLLLLIFFSEPIIFPHGILHLHLIRYVWSWWTRIPSWWLYN